MEILAHLNTEKGRDKMMWRYCFVCVAAALLQPVWAGPVGSFSADFNSYAFTATCSIPPGAPVAPPGSCFVVSIPLNATGATSLFANSEFTAEQTLTFGPVPPFPFTGTFILTNLANPADSIFGTMVGQGEPTGPPGPPIGLPPFGVTALLTTTGGTGAFVGAQGFTEMYGTAIYEFLSPDATFTSGDGTLKFSPIPEPGTLFLFSAAAFVAAARIIVAKRRVVMSS